MAAGPEQRDAQGRLFTSPASEVTAIRPFARTLYHGPVDAWEQYFPTRLIADDVAFLMGARSGDLDAALHEDGPQRKPVIEFVAGEGVITASGDKEVEPGAEPRRRVVVDGYNHLDVTTARRRTLDGRPEPVSSGLVCFALEVVRTKPAC